MKNQNCSTFSVSLLAVAISGCSSWPHHGQGGDAQMDTSHDYYVEQVDSTIGYDHQGYTGKSHGHHEMHDHYDGDYYDDFDETFDNDFHGRYRHSYRFEGKGQLETQWSIHSLKLDTLVLRGGQECLPARVREVSVMAKRARRELDGNLLEDARNTLIIYQRELDELERRLLYVKRHTQCNQSQNMSANFELSTHQKYQNRKHFLLNLLNDEYSFDVDSDQLARHYQEKLVVAAHYLMQDTSIKLQINGHTDSAGDYKYNQRLALKRAQKVKNVLVNAGVDIKRLIVRSFGEQLPIDTNLNVLGRTKNRRVMVEFIEHEEFYIPGADGKLFEQKNEIFGFSSNEVKKAKYLKYWNKKVGSNHEGMNHDY